MTPSKSANRGPSRSPSAPAPAAEASTESKRKPWKKKTPLEIFIGQIERLREQVAEKEEELNQAKRQLQKLEEARKLLESA